MAVDEATLEVVRAAMRQKTPKVPGAYDRVLKEECAFSFDTPLSPGGLFVNLSTWQSFGEEYVLLDYQRSNNRLYLHQQWHKVCSSQNHTSLMEFLPGNSGVRVCRIADGMCRCGPLWSYTRVLVSAMAVDVQVPLPDEEKASMEAKPDKLAIGGDGGFQVDADKFTIEKINTLVVLPEFLRLPLPCPELPDIVIQAIDGVLVSPCPTAVHMSFPIAKISLRMCQENGKFSLSW